MATLPRPVLPRSWTRRALTLMVWEMLGAFEGAAGWGTGVAASWSPLIHNGSSSLLTLGASVFSLGACPSGASGPGLGWHRDEGGQRMAGSGPGSRLGILCLPPSLEGRSEWTWGLGGAKKLCLK